MSIEERVRTATRATAATVHEIRPLTLPAEESSTCPHWFRPLRTRPHWGAWLVPLTAAMAVIAVAATLVAVRNPPHAADKASAGPAVSHSAGPTSVAAPADPEAVPGYFVAISNFALSGPLPAAGQSGTVTPPRPDSVVVGGTLTGQRLATITPPAGSTFIGVTGASDDRTFLLDSVPVKTRSGFLSATEQRTWYLLTIRPGATPVTTLTRLSFPVPSAADVDGISLSPDGTKLAVFYQLPRTGDGFPYSGPFTLAVYSVPAGTVVRSWTGTDPYHGSLGYGSDGPPDRNDLLSWTSDGQHLAFGYRSSTNPRSDSLYLREVSLSNPGTGLFADSAVVATIAGPTPTDKFKVWCGSLGITGDGRTALCGAELPKVPQVGATLDAVTEPGPWVGCASPADAAYPGIAAISLTSDKLARVLYEFKPSCMGAGTATILWSSPSGNTVIGNVSYTDDPSMKEHSEVVLFSHGKATTLNWPGAGTLLSGETTAF